MSQAGQMWGARFQGKLDPEFALFQRSLGDDYLLAFADLQTNREWTKALAQAGIFTNDECARVLTSIDALHQQWTAHGVPLDGPDEDVHSLVERELVARCGDLAKRIHTGRSRNDQVATDLRLYLRDVVADLHTALHGLCSALLHKARLHAADPLPGYTHLQRAQPITIGHHALAYVEAFARDRSRLLDAARRMDVCPLGSGALAGTTAQVDRAALAAALGFAGGASHNSIDATAGRDHLCELLFVVAMATTHLSRLAEDYIFFATQEAGFVRFGDAVSTGSSMMPQKRNPDAMELIRGKAGRMQGALTAMLATLKGLPMGYNRDLQTDKETLLPALLQAKLCLRIAATAVANSEFQVTRCQQQSEVGYLNATDLADLLVAAGVPFRHAHELVGAAVNRAVELGVELQDLPANDQQRLLPQLRCNLKAELATERVLQRRKALGGTAPLCVAAEVRRWEQQLAQWQSPTQPQQP